MPFPEFEPSVPSMLRHVVERFGDRPLISIDERRLTYAQAEAESARLARGLLARGVAKGTRVGVLYPNGPDWLVAWLAAMRIGAIAVPINTFYKTRELGWTLHHADVHTLITTAQLLSHDYQQRIEEFAPGLAGQKAQGGPDLRCPELPYLRQVLVSGGEPRPWAEPLEAVSDGSDAIDADFLARVEACVCPADPAVIIYSSGSTADPKGAVHTQGTLIRHAFNLNVYREVTPDDRIWSPMPYFWVGGLVVSLLQNMLEGCSLICQEAFEPGETLALLERERATLVSAWPQYMQALRGHPDYLQRDLSSVRSGGFVELLPEEEQIQDPELRSNSLGMTETCGPHTFYDMTVQLPENLRGSFGMAVEGVEHKVIDPDSGETLPVGEHGEICVRGYSLMQGLYKREREDVFDGAGFYHTGDGGHFNDEGHLFFKARLGEMIKTGGANVTPREVEVILEAQPEVQSAFVVGVPHPDRGQNVAAAVILAEGAALAPDELRTRLREEMAAYKVPRHVFFCGRDELPFTDSGKMQKKALATLLEQRLEAGIES